MKRAQRDHGIERPPAGVVPAVMAPGEQNSEGETSLEGIPQVTAFGSYHDRNADVESFRPGPMRLDANTAATGQHAAPPRYLVRLPCTIQ